MPRFYSKLALVFVTLEGPEGAGKSTVASNLKARIEAVGREVVLTREPGSPGIGQSIRELLLHTNLVEPRAELFLFLADRAQHVAKTVLPALDAGKIVLCDRYADSTVVYQGYARGFDLKLLRELNRLATGGLVPDLTLLLDISPEIGLSRQSEKDRLDSEPLEFHEKVRSGFLEESALEPKRWRVVDAQLPVEEVVEQCFQWVKASLQTTS